MPDPGSLPVGDEFYATIRRPGLEEVIDHPRKFPTSAAALRHAIRAIDAMRKPAPAPPTQEELDAEIHRKWKAERALEHARLRAAFDLRNVEVVSRKRRIIR